MPLRAAQHFSIDQVTDVYSHRHASPGGYATANAEDLLPILAGAIITLVESCYGLSVYETMLNYRFGMV